MLSPGKGENSTEASYCTRGSFVVLSFKSRSRVNAPLCYPVNGLQEAKTKWGSGPTILVLNDTKGSAWLHKSLLLLFPCKSLTFIILTASTSRLRSLIIILSCYFAPCFLKHSIGRKIYLFCFSFCLPVLI